MKYIVFNSSSFAHPHYGIQLDDAERLYREGHEVTFTYCDGILDSCFMNPEANSAICRLCKFGYQHSLSKLSKGIKVIPLKKSKIQDKYVFDYNSIDEIKNIIYRDVSVGYAILSTYISNTRNPNPIISSKSMNYFDHLINETCDLTNLIYDLIEKIRPDAISIYNGRFYENRPFFDIAKSMNLLFISNEIIGGVVCNELFYKVSFINCLPHDIKYNCDSIKNLWNSSTEDEEVKIRKGETFFINRRDGIPTSDRVYITNQKKGKLPLNWNVDKKNIVIFNASEDEFAAIGAEFDQISLFKSQIEGIKFMLSSINDENYHFYLRIHPNLKNILYNYHTDLYLFSNTFSNITIIGANEDISTYDIMDAAYKVVVFGSTMGIEACYWGKPVILLSPSLYYYLDSCYIPNSCDELIDLLKTDDLKPKNNLPAIQYGYYTMDRDVLTFKSNYFDINYKSFVFIGFKINAIRYLTLFGSSKLFKIVAIVFFRISGYLGIRKLDMPDPIFND